MEKKFQYILRSWEGASSKDEGGADGGVKNMRGMARISTENFHQIKLGVSCVLTSADTMQRL